MTGRVMDRQDEKGNVCNMKESKIEDEREAKTAHKKDNWEMIKERQYVVRDKAFWHKKSFPLQ